jgi:hypothetical protein
VSTEVAITRGDGAGILLVRKTVLCSLVLVCFWSDDGSRSERLVGLIGDLNI